MAAAVVRLFLCAVSGLMAKWMQSAGESGVGGFLSLTLRGMNEWDLRWAEETAHSLLKLILLSPL